jgi:uncharacterized RDD family membrane protein YckC
MPRQGQAAPPGYAPPEYGVPPGYPPGWRTVWNPVGPAGQPLASFGDRLLAYLVDAAILLAVGLVTIPLAILGLVLVMAPSGTRGDAAVALLMLLAVATVFVLNLAITYLYYVEMMFRSGQTVGKRALKIRVVPLEPRARLDRPTAVKRWLVQCVAAWIPVVGYVDGLWQLWDRPFQQCLHDKYAQTVVIKVNP